MNKLPIDSLEEKLRRLRRSRVDADFASMRHDSHYREEVKAVADEFAATDWESFLRGERERK